VSKGFTGENGHYAQSSQRYCRQLGIKRIRTRPYNSEDQRKSRQVRTNLPTKVDPHAAL